MGEGTGETGDQLTRPELSDKQKKEAVANIVAWYRYLGYSEEKIRKIKADLLSNLQAEVVENFVHQFGEIVEEYRYLGYSEEKIRKIKADLLSNLQKKLRLEIERDELYGKKDEILKEMAKKCVSIKNAEVEGYKGKKIRITLPEQKGGFEGKTYEVFISNRRITKEEFKSKPELVNKSWGIKNVGDLLGAIRKYMEARGVKGIDADLDYYEDTLTKSSIFEVGDYLKKIIEIKTGKYALYECKSFFLKDKIKRRQNTQAVWNCNAMWCFVASYELDRYSDAYLLLKSPYM